MAFTSPWKSCSGKKTNAAHLVSLMSDVIYEIREDSSLFTDNSVDADDYIGNLTQTGTIKNSDY